jgi:hypothetical protein
MLREPPAKHPLYSFRNGGAGSFEQAQAKDEAHQVENEFSGVSGDKHLQRG